MLNIVILSKSHLKKLKEYKLALILTIAVAFTSFSQNPVGIGTVTPHQSAILEVSSEDKGFLPPRMSAGKMDSIVSPAKGLMVYCKDCTPKGIYISNGDEFRQLQFLEKPFESLYIADVRIIKGTTASFDISPTLTPSGATVTYKLITNPSGVTMVGTRINIDANTNYGKYNITVKATGKDDYSGETEATFKLNVVPPPTDAACFTFSSGTITDYTCPSIVDVVIPASIGGVAVRSIGWEVFRNKDISSVYIPDSVTSIGGRAFYENNLTSVYIPDSVTSIGNYAFATNKFSTITIPDSVTSIGIYAFADTDISSVTISNSVTNIGDYAFQYNRLTSVYIPDSVTNIGDYAFAFNVNLTSVSIKFGTVYTASSFYKDTNTIVFIGLCTEDNGCITIRQ